MAIESFWDRCYRDGSHREHWEAPTVPSELVELVEETASRGAADSTAALDLGCGTGLEAVFLARNGHRVIGIDTSLTALALARERAAESNVEVRWCRGSALDLPLDDRSVGLVTDRGCFHLFEPEDRPRYAAEVSRVLRPGGRFLLRCARDDDEETGVFGLEPVGSEAPGLDATGLDATGLDATGLDDLFPPHRFHRGPLIATELAAPAGDLPAYRVLLQRRR